MSNRRKGKSVQLKIIILGDSAVGKTSIVKRYQKNEFSEDHKKTIGVDFCHVTREFAGKQYHFGIWDTAGQEKFQSLMPDYYRGSKGVIFVYDITQIGSFNHIKRWKKEVEKYLDEDEYCPILVGNKLDLNHLRVIKRRKGEEFSEKNGLMFIETSAKTSTNITTAFDFIMKKVAETNDRKTLHQSSGYDNDEKLPRVKLKGKNKNMKRKSSKEKEEKEESGEEEESTGCCY